MPAIPRVLVLAAIFVVALSIPTASADQITVMWDANPPEQQVLGYRVAVYDETGVIGDYDVSNQTFFVFPDAVAGREYVFAVAAYSSAGMGTYAFLAGYSDAPPVLEDPGDRANLLGDSVVFQLDAYDIYGDPITYGASGLPTGLTLNQSTGLITGTATTMGTYPVTISATDGFLTTEVSFNWYIDGAPPVVAITTPTAQPTYTINVSALGVGGTANDDVGVSSVSWANNRGGTGFATLTSSTTWTIPSLTLKVGDNIITVTARDFANRTATDVITVTFAGGAVPAVVIDTPTSGPTYTTASNGVLLTGTASPGLIAMTWSTNRGAHGNVNYIKPPSANFSIWNIPAVPLQPGVNVITVSAQDVFEAIGNAVLTVTMNRAPVITNPGTQSSLQGVAVVTPIAATDLDGNPLTWTATGLPPGLAIHPSTGVISGAPLTTGPFWTEVTASDGIASDTESFSWTVNAVTVTPMVTAADKAYDGTTTTTLTSCTVAGTQPGHVVTCTGNADFDTPAAGAGKAVTATGLQLTGPDAGYYTLASLIAGTTASITPLPVTPVITVADKQYDATPAATLASCTVIDALADDVVHCDGTVAFETASAGIDKPVSALGLYLTGAAAANYFLSTATATTTASITTRPVAPIVAVADKPYDGTTGATLANCTVSGAVGGDVVGCTGVATFESATAGAGKAVTVTGFTLTGAVVGNYALSTTTALTTASITRLAVTPIVAAADKLFDGTAIATLTSCTVTGVLAGDVVACTGTAVFDNASAGAGKLVTASGLTLTGPSAANYVLSSATATTTASITSTVVTPLVTVADKPYDRTTTATLTTCTVLGASGGDVVACTGTAAFDTANAAAGKTVTVSGITLTGADAGNYQLASTTASTTANITAATVTAVITAANKVYDGTTAATLTSCTVTGQLGGDVVGCTGTATFDTAAAGAGKTVTGDGLTLTGAAAPNYVLAGTSATTIATITPLTVSPVVTASDKPYDGTTSATLASCTVTGAVGGDVVACTGTASFGTALVGSGKTVTASGLTLTGGAAGNYVLSATTAMTTAAITARPVTPAVTAANKTYDGTTTATLTSCTVTGAIGADVVACSGTVAFDTAGAGLGKTVTASGLNLTGAAAANYVLSSATATTTADINPATVTAAITAANKVYDSTTTATLTNCTVTGQLGGDVVACAGTATFDTAAVGAGKTVTGSGLTLTGSAATNYVLAATSATTTAAITSLTVSPVVTASDKPYDGTTSATLTSCTVTGAVGGDLVACIGTASFGTATVGSGKTVTATGLSLTGAAAGNYVLASTTATTTAAITARSVAPSVTSANKTYDGTTDATLASCTVTGALGGDVVACTGMAAFDTADAGTGKTVTANGLTLTGAAAANYALSSTTATTTANIAAATVTAAITAASKVYDRTAAATLTSCTVTGPLEGDAVSCTGTATFDTASAGAGKTVTAIGLTLSGADAANYVLASTTAATIANITAASVSPAVTAANKVYDGTTSATVTACTVTGSVAGDVVACSGSGAFDTSQAGTGKTVTANGLTLTGAAATNYVLSSTSATTTATITRASVTAAITAANKDYDATATATLTSCALTGVIGADVVACTGTASFDNANAGAGKTVTSSDLALTGAAAGNYVLSSTTATTTAAITNPDTTAPTLAVTAPTSTGTYSTTNGTIAVGGTANDNVGVTQVSWATNRGASGVATDTTAWSIASVPLGAGTTVITVTARDAANNTASTTLTVTFLPPAAATLIAPNGTIDTAVPSFSWAASPGATHYQLWVNDQDEQERINVTYTAAAAGCTTAPATCSVAPGVTLAPGAALWWVRPSNAAGVASWGAGFTFSVPAPPDTTAPVVAFVTPTAAATYPTMTSTLAFSGTAGDNVGVIQVSWATDRGTSGVATGTSSWTIASMPLVVGTTVITVTARDAANNTATTTLSVTYTPPAPGAVTLMAPSGVLPNATPSFSWNAVTGATNYQLWVNDSSQEPHINVTYTAAAAGCASGTGTCSVSPGVSLAPGAATWFVRASNTAGASPWGTGLTMTVPAPPDVAAPTLALTMPTTSGTYTTTSTVLALGGTAVDNVGVTQVSWTTTHGDSGMASGTTSWSIPALPLGAGTTVVTVTARDAANNASSTTLTVTFNGQPPGAAALVAPTGTIATSTPNFTWAAVSGATHYQLWVNDAGQQARINVTYTAAAVGCSAGTGTCTVSPGVTLASGEALWWIRASNAAGVGPWAPGLSFTVPAAADTAVPVVAVTSPTSTGTYAATSGTLTVGGTASDNVGVTLVSWTTNRGGSGVATGTTTWSIASVPLAAGDTVITVTARDAANNTSSTTLTVSYNQAPGTPTLLTPTGSIGTGTPSFTWTAVSGATHYLLWVNDASQQAKINVTYTAAAVGCSAGTGTCAVSPNVALAGGSALWWIRASNGAVAGNWSSGVSFTVPATADSTLPAITLTTPTSTGTYASANGSIAVAGTASDNVGVTQVSWSTDRGASGIATGTTGWSIAAVPLGAGTTVLTVTARDAANNTRSTTLTVTYNALPPAGATLLGPNGTVGTATPTFTWAAVSGATHYLLWVNDATTQARVNVTYTAAAAGCASGTGTCTINPGTALAPGAGLWWIRTSNAAGLGPWSSGMAFTVSAP